MRHRRQAALRIFLHCPLAIPGGAVSSDTVLAAAGGSNSKHADVWSLWSVCIFISVALGRTLKGCQQ